jgi:hypothetical protein
MGGRGGGRRGEICCQWGGGVEEGEVKAVALWSSAGEERFTAVCSSTFPSVVAGGGEGGEEGGLGP